MGLPSGVGRSEASEGFVGVMEPSSRPLRLTLIFLAMTISYGFLMVLAFKREPKFEYFPDIFCKRRFCEIQRFVSTRARFPTSGACKKGIQINTKTKLEKGMQIMPFKLDFWAPWGTPKYSKIKNTAPRALQKSPKN